MIKPDKVIPEKCIGFAIEEKTSELTTRDVLLYAIGIGYSQDPLEEKDLQYTFEMHDEFKVFPTTVLLGKVLDPFEILTNCPGIPNFNPMMLLHGEQKTEIRKPLEIGKKYRHVGRVIDVSDKVIGCLCTVEARSFEENEDGVKGDLAVITTISFFIREIGGFGYKGNLQNKLPEIPNSPPNFEVEEYISPNLAIIFRLCGDTNPLHISPSMATFGGFERPIHLGLSTYGICAKLIVKKMANGNGDKLKMIRGRFTSHVFPGDTLVLRGWVTGNQVVFNAVTKERRKVVIIGVCYVEGAHKL